MSWRQSVQESSPPLDNTHQSLSNFIQIVLDKDAGLLLADCDLWPLLRTDNQDTDHMNGILNYTLFLSRDRTFMHVS